MKRSHLLIACLALLILSCRRRFEVDLPEPEWTEFDAPGTAPLSGLTARRMEGLLSVTGGREQFGAGAVMQWSYEANGSDTVFYVSFFCEKDISYIVCQGRRRDSTLLLKGYWRRMAGTQTGRVRLTVRAEAGGRYLFGNPSASASDLMLEGVYGQGQAVPDQPLRLRYQRALVQRRPLEILAHRGGGLSADLLPASENSLELLPHAARFGATGVEIDVQMTRDGVPVLYHDATLNERLVIRNGMVGALGAYSFAQLRGLVRLVRNGERIPSLREALDVILYRTSLRFVWLDIKYNGSLETVRALQEEYAQRAVAMGRNLEIVIGIPDREVLQRFRELPGHRQLPSLCELGTEETESIDARIWAPRWTLGLQNDQVAAQQARGRRVFVWTLDLPANISLFLQQGRFNGILSNYPSAVVYAYYTQP